MQKQDIDILLILHFQRLMGIVIFHHYSILWLVRWYLVCYITMIHGQWLRIMIKELGMSLSQAWFGNFSNRCVQFLIPKLRRLHGCHKLIGGMRLGHEALEFKDPLCFQVWVRRLTNMFIQTSYQGNCMWIFFQEYPTDQWFLPVFGFRTLELRECRRVR